MHELFCATYELFFNIYLVRIYDFQNLHVIYRVVINDNTSSVKICSGPQFLRTLIDNLVCVTLYMVYDQSVVHSHPCEHRCHVINNVLTFHHNQLYINKSAKVEFCVYSSRFDWHFSIKLHNRTSPWLAATFNHGCRSLLVSSSTILVCKKLLYYQPWIFFSLVYVVLSTNWIENILLIFAVLVLVSRSAARAALVPLSNCYSVAPDTHVYDLVS